MAAAKEEGEENKKKKKKNIPKLAVLSSTADAKEDKKTDK